MITDLFKPVDKQDAVQSAAAGILVFGLFLLTACPTFYTGDSAELAAATALFGVPHPPGYPLYTMLTASLVHLVPLAPGEPLSIMCSEDHSSRFLLDF